MDWQEGLEADFIGEGARRRTKVHEGCSHDMKNAVKPLNAELNPICHLLIQLGDLKFMGTCDVSIF
jgi:hypothetical protein